MEQECAIKVIGIGGGGMHAVHHMITSELRGVTFIVAGTDAQALACSRCENTIQLGGVRFQGLSRGPGPNWQIGKEAAQESIEEIKAVLAGAELVFIVAGMGGSTGSGAAPVIAQTARELGALTIGVVTSPFPFEGKRRLTAAEGAITDLYRVTDCLILIPNSQIQLAAEGMNLEGMMREADEAMHSAVRGISDLLVHQGLISLDFADVQAVLRGAGMAAMGTGSAFGAKRASRAVICALDSPLLSCAEIGQVRSALVNITCGDEPEINEVNEVIKTIYARLPEDAKVLFGVLVRNELGAGKLHVTIIATDMGIKPSRWVP